MSYKYYITFLIITLFTLKGIAQQPFFAGQTGDSIVFTDIDPNGFVDYNSQYLIDIDKDGNNDFKIAVTVTEGGAMSRFITTSISGINENKIIYTPTPILDTNGICPSYKIAKIFNYGNSIGMLKDSCKETKLYYSTISNIGLCQATEWSNGKDPKYIGVVLNRNDSLFYGWIKVLVAPTVTVMEYAVNIKLITQIQSQQGNQSIKVFPNPTKDFINLIIPNSTNYKNYNLILMNDLGVNIIEEKINENNYTLDLRELISGKYFLVISDDYKVYTKQMILKR